MDFNPGNLMWVLAQAEGGGLLSKKVVIIIVAVLVLGGLVYWFKGRGK